MIDEIAADLGSVRERARDQLERDLAAKRAALQSYRRMIRDLGDEESATRSLLEQIRAVEDRHEQDLSRLLATLGPARPGTPVDASVEDAYWREHFATRPYVRAGELYENFQPAYRRGWEARGRYGELNWESAEAELRREWQHDEAPSKLSWEVARQAARDAWDRLDPTADYSSDNR